MEAVKQNKFKTDVVNIHSLDKYDFTIPTYQRPYVWGDEQLKKILDDFYQSFKNDPDSIYYIGTFLTKDTEYLSELIDDNNDLQLYGLSLLLLVEFVPNQILFIF